ncbi:MAG: tannase/feruloyl esterase family alpha/beta hydrolase [Gemmatimonadota bacterium]|nr:MAG: tannase/feruloyl esterase family alpha/beta hydrolase [Gemmatimonadota bacterium]
MKYLVFQDPDWDYSTYDFSTFASDVAAVSSTLDATDSDLDAFRERGGKLLMYNGWRDMALTPLGTIEYYEQVIEREASAPDQVTAYWIDEQMQPDGSRLACAYPNVLEYDGVGDPRDAASFSCVNPNQESSGAESCFSTTIS